MNKKETNRSKWWSKSVIYEIYSRSFQDTNNDGIGDLQGVIKRLDYLKELGVDAIWLTPVCKSPQEDNGYDISDYQDIDPLFGKLEDMDALIREAGKYDIKIILDLVLNHSSDEHPWFIEAKKGKDNPYHDYYVWRDGVEGIPPNDMKACFGGSCWEWVPELSQYYFHQFAVKQPDLNWENPKLRREIINMINWWIDRGIGGFRLDVIDQIAKEPDEKITCNGPRLHEFIRELSKETFQRAELITVGEAWGADVERAKLYSNPDGSEFSMVFQFEHSNIDQIPGKEKWDLKSLDLVRLKQVFRNWQTGLYKNGWNSLFWDNHDLPRIVSRWGNDGLYREESAKMLATVLHGMQGTPYIYQGEELGMTNAYFSIEDYRDIESINLYRERREKGYSHEDIMKSLHAKSRDNARTPMQWDDSENAGFTSGEPWIKVNPNYKEINAARQRKDENSVFSYYKKLIAFRKEYDIFTEGDFTLHYEEHPEIFVYERNYKNQRLVVIANFFGNGVAFNREELLRKENAICLLHNYMDEEVGILRPYESYMYFIEKEK